MNSQSIDTLDAVFQVRAVLDSDETVFRIRTVNPVLDSDDKVIHVRTTNAGLESEDMVVRVRAGNPMLEPDGKVIHVRMESSVLLVDCIDLMALALAFGWQPFQETEDSYYTEPVHLPEALERVKTELMIDYPERQESLRGVLLDHYLRTWGRDELIRAIDELIDADRSRMGTGTLQNTSPVEPGLGRGEQPCCLTAQVTCRAPDAPTV